jgi:hypothetical protein
MKKHFIFNAPFEMKDKEGNKYTLKIEQDDCAESPREWDNVATMVCWYRGYSLGDEHNYSSTDEFFEEILHDICGIDYDDFEELSTREKYQLAYESDKIHIKELNAYEHGMITISTSNGYPYNDRWDAGCIGFVYITKETAFKELVAYVLDENGERIKEEHKHPNGQSTWSYKTQLLTDETWKERADEIIESEVKIYNQYLQNEVYGFTLTKTAIQQDKCPHCGEVISEYEEEVEVDSCWGFYGCEIETNGILDSLTNLEFVD